jgi:hypothetical protein
MRWFVVSGLLVSSVLFGMARAGYAGCGKNPSDEAAVIAARTAAASACDCATASSHGAYVSCVAGVAKGLVTAKQLPANCAGAVKKCAAHATCGKAGFVTCCVTTSKGPKCKLKKNAAACTAKGGTATVDPLNTSCCSATHPLTENACMASPSGAFVDAATAF